MQLLRTKSLASMMDEAARPERQLKRVLGSFDLVLLGIGAVIGAGIFATVGTAAAGDPSRPGAGPALILSFVLTGVACAFAALCYAEMASMVPISGSAYTYAYATLGELVAWIIGWDLIIEYAVGNVAVAISWAGYFNELLRGFGLPFPAWLGIDYRSAAQAAAQVAGAQAGGVDLTSLGDGVTRAAQALVEAPHAAGIPLIFNLPAFVIVMLITWVLVRGISESAWLNTSMVALNLVIITLFVLVGVFYLRPENC